MGLWREFSCPACGYACEVSGEPDSGREDFTNTVACSTCRELYDVVVAERTEGEPRPVEPRCPNDPHGTHSIEPWEYPGPCPRCGHQMEVGGITAIWD